MFIFIWDCYEQMVSIFLWIVWYIVRAYSTVEIWVKTRTHKLMFTSSEKENKIMYRLIEKNVEQELSLHECLPLLKEDNFMIATCKKDNVKYHKILTLSSMEKEPYVESLDVFVPTNYFWIQIFVLVNDTTVNIKLHSDDFSYYVCNNVISRNFVIFLLKKYNLYYDVIHDTTNIELIVLDNTAKIQNITFSKMCKGVLLLHNNYEIQ